MRKHFYIRMSILLMLTTVLLFSGCGGGHEKGCSGSCGNCGNYRLSVQWPEGGDIDRIIPSGSQTITVEIEGENLDEPLSSSITYPDTEISISEIPAGNKVATIKALNGPGQVAAQRKESFEIIGFQTHESGEIPLGIAVTGTTDNPVFEPATLPTAYGQDFIIQNWLENPYTVQGAGPDINLNAVTTGGTGLQIFDQAEVKSINVFNLTLNGESAACAINTDIPDYIYADSYSCPDVWGIDKDQNGNVVAARYSNDVVSIYNSSGSKIDQLGGVSGSENGQFNQPLDVSVDPSGNIYVVDEYNYRIQKFNSDGSFAAKWGSSGSDNSEFNLPRGIGYSPDSHIFVADTDNHRIQKFTTDGQFVMKFGQYGTGNGDFNGPRDVTVNSSGDIYVCDTENDRVQKFDSLGNFITKFGAEGTGDELLNFPTQLRIGDYDSVYLADRENHRIKMFDRNHNLVTVWGGRGTSAGEFDSPIGLTIMDDGSIYVGDWKNNRIQHFTQ